jgi:uncharacterized phage-associated protein
MSALGVMLVAEETPDGRVTEVAKVDDVAAAIVRRTGPIDTWKLQKLAYYCQAWHLVWDGEPLFPSRIEAWANGPVVPALYRTHRGQYRVESWSQGDPSNLRRSERGSIAAVLDTYARKSGQWLAALTHSERPWKEARKGLAAGERGHREITKEAMLEYYGSLV